MVNRAMRNQPMMRTMRIEEIIKIQEEISEKTSGPLYTMVLCMDIVNIIEMNLVGVYNIEGLKSNELLSISLSILFFFLTFKNITSLYVLNFPGQG